MGNDCKIKIWSLDETDNIYRSGKVWCCRAETNYKNLPIESISFSQDGSLLAAGFGNTLCIYKSESLKLRAALTGAAGLDGCVQKVQVKLPQQIVNGSKNEHLEQRKRLLQLFNNLIENNDEALIKEIKKSLPASKIKQNDSSHQVTELDESQKMVVFNKIMQMHELNLYQKILLYQKLGIRFLVSSSMRVKLLEYLQNSIHPHSLKRRHEKLSSRLHCLNLKDRFKAKFRLQELLRRKHHVDAKVEHLVPVLSLLSFKDSIKDTSHLTNGAAKKSVKMKSPETALGTLLCANTVPTQTLANIGKVQFAAGEYAHLVGTIKLKCRK